jgi:hypothetical protein
MRVPQSHYDGLWVMVLLAAVPGLFFGILAGVVTHSWLVFAVTACALPAFVLLWWVYGAIRHLLSTPADYSYTQDGLRHGLGYVPSEDPIAQIIQGVFQANADAGAPPDEPRKVYPCSRAIPKEVWEKTAMRAMKSYNEIVVRAEAATPGEAAQLLTKAAVGFNSITLGAVYDSSEYNQKARPLLPRALELLSQADNMQAMDRVRCLHEIGAVAAAQGMDDVALVAYERLMPLARTLISDQIALACLLSNYAGIARRAGRGALAKELKAEANAIWKDVPHDVIELHIVERV